MPMSRLVAPLLAGLAVALSAPAAVAQAPVPEEVKVTMAPLAWMAGRWSGEGTYQGPEGPQTVLQIEDVRSALEGSLLVVEGTGREHGGSGEPGPVVFRAFGVLSAGDTPGRYRFAAWQGGRFVDAGAELAEDGTITWGFETPQGGEVRYVIRRLEPDVWHEAGSFRAPGGDVWSPFFEMTLRREAGGAR